MKLNHNLFCILLILFAFKINIIAQVIEVSGKQLTMTNISLNTGETLQLQASGRVTLGIFAGSTDADGLSAFQNYNLVSGVRHGALLGRIQGGNWQLIGKKGTLVADRTGRIEFMVNDKDASNNSGSFSVEVLANWLDALPDCPCIAPAERLVGDGWARDDAEAVAKFHPGARICFRSYPAVRTIEGNSGQQCCYNINNRLITGGAASGTPDKESSCKGENDDGSMDVWYLNTLYHYAKDVYPFENMPLNQYLQLWKPNNDNGCPANIK